MIIPTVIITKNWSSEFQIFFNSVDQNISNKQWGTSWMYTPLYILGIYMFTFVLSGIYQSENQMDTDELWLSDLCGLCCFWISLDSSLPSTGTEEAEKPIRKLISILCSALEVTSARLVTILAEHKVDLPNSSNKFGDGLSVSSWQS